MNNVTGRNVIQEIGLVTVVLMLASNAWLLVADMNHRSSDSDEMRKLVDEANRLAKQNSAILAERQPIIYGTADTTKKNQKMILDNQRKIEEAIEAIKRLEPKPKGE